MLQLFGHDQSSWFGRVECPKMFLNQFLRNLPWTYPVLWQLSSDLLVYLVSQFKVRVSARGKGLESRVFFRILSTVYLHDSQSVRVGIVDGNVFSETSIEWYSEADDPGQMVWIRRRAAFDLKSSSRSEFSKKI